MHGLRQEYDSRHRHGMLPSSRSSSVAGSRPTTADSWQAYITVQPSQTPMHSSSSLSCGDAASDIAQTVNSSWPFAQSPAPHAVATHGASQSLVQQQPRRHRHDGIAGQQAHTGSTLLLQPLGQACKSISKLCHQYARSKAPAAGPGQHTVSASWSA